MMSLGDQEGRLKTQSAVGQKKMGRRETKKKDGALGQAEVARRVLPLHL